MWENCIVSTIIYRTVYLAVVYKYPHLGLGALRDVVDEHENIKGHKTVPCGTPDLTFSGSDIAPFSSTWWVQVVIYYMIQLSFWNYKALNDELFFNNGITQQIPAGLNIFPWSFFKCVIEFHFHNVKSSLQLTKHNFPFSANNLSIVSLNNIKSHNKHYFVQIIDTADFASRYIWRPIAQ